MKCPDCGGTGYVEDTCPNCGGDCEAECHTCWGEGEVDDSPFIEDSDPADESPGEPMG